MKELLEKQQRYPRPAAVQKVCAATHGSKRQAGPIKSISKCQRLRQNSLQLLKRLISSYKPFCYVDDLHRYYSL